MLGKLLKYELKASSRHLLPLYLGIAVVSLMCAFMINGNINTFSVGKFMNGPMLGTRVPDFLQGMVFLLLFGLMVAMAVLTVVSIIQRFSQNLLGDEGFLMFTLPVSSTKLLLSKLLAAFIWLMASSLMGLVSIMIMVGIPMLLTPGVNWGEIFNELFYLLQYYWDDVAQAALICGEITILGFLGAFATILTAYLAMMVGQLQQFSRHRIVVSVVAFFLISWVVGWLGYPLNRLYGDGFDLSAPVSFVAGLLALNTVVALVQCVLLFFGTKWMIDNKLNL